VIRRIDLPDDLDAKLRVVAKRRDLSDGYVLARIVEAEIERQYAELLEAEEVRSR